MTTCTDNVCGTGDWTGPKPGDPDTSAGAIALRATAIWGGIEVSWSYPSINPEAVSYTRLYRSTSSNFGTAVELSVVSGNRYVDQISTEGTYYYWIKIVSIYGTVGDLIGPASATASSRAADIIQDITGKIDSGNLANELKSKIDRVELVEIDMRKEILDRINANNALGNSMETIRNGLNDAIGILDSEVTARLNGQDALVRQYDILAVANANNTAGIINEANLRLTEDSALLTKINTLQTTTGNNITSIRSDITLLTDKNTALTQKVDTTYAKVETNTAAIQDETIARVNQDSAISQRITTVESSFNGQLAQVQLSLQTAVGDTNTKITTIDGKVAAIGSQLVAKTNVNGLVGGFGVYNSGVTVEAGFDVDTFWIGRTNSDKRKPFIIDNGIIYMDKVVIRDGDIDSLKIAGQAVNGRHIVNGAISAVNVGSVTNKLITQSGGLSVILDGLGYGENGEIRQVYGICVINFANQKGIAAPWDGYNNGAYSICAKINCPNTAVPTLPVTAMATSLASTVNESQILYDTAGTMVITGLWPIPWYIPNPQFDLISVATTMYGRPYPTQFIVDSASLMLLAFKK